MSPYLLEGLFPAANYLTLGILMLVGLLAGHFIRRVSGIPSVTGYVLVGLVLGPDALDLISHAMLEETQGIVDLALGMILYQLGVSLDLRAALGDRRLLTASGVECAATFLLVSGAMLAVGLALHQAVLLGAMAMSTSPAVLLHVAREVRAQGPVTEASRLLVALNNLASFLMYMAVVPLMHLASGAARDFAFLQPLYLCVGSVVLGAAIGALLVRVERWIAREEEYRLALVIGAVLLTLGLARASGLSAMFALLILGVTVRTLSPSDRRLDRVVLGPATEVLYIVMFVVAGASIDLNQFPMILVAVPALLLARGLAKWGMVYQVMRRGGAPVAPAQATGLLLLPMASLAIALARRTALQFPEVAGSVPSIVLASVAALETFGPILSAYAFRLCGEAGRAPGPPGEDSRSA